MSDQPRAQIRMIDGQPVLEDADALAMVRAIAKVNCRVILEAQTDRVEHFRQRALALGRTSIDVVITLIQVDDPHGRLLADALMPGQDWNQYRQRGEEPFARGLADRSFVQAFLDATDAEAARKLRDWQGMAVIVVANGVVEVF